MFQRDVGSNLLSTANITVWYKTFRCFHVAAAAASKRYSFHHVTSSQLSRTGGAEGGGLRERDIYASQISVGSRVAEQFLEHIIRGSRCLTISLASYIAKQSVSKKGIN